MELSLKKTALALVALGLSSAAFAASYTPEPAPACTPGNVTVPCEKTAWDVGFTGMYVQATNDDLHDYQTGGPVAAGTTNSFNTHVLSPDWDFAFNLQGSYHWGTGNDVNLNWTHYSNTHNSAVSGGAAGGGAGSPNGRFVGPFNNINSSVKFQHDAVNLEFGQMINVGDHVNMRFHAGGQWARVDGTFTQTGINNAPVGANASATDTNTSEFNGVGPRFGMDASYHFGNGLSIVGRSAAALLVGDIDTNNNQSVTTGAGVTTVTIVTQKERTIVPSLNADLGVGYTHAMAQGDLGLEAGYRVATVMQSVRWVDSANTNGGLTGNEVSNFGYHGPYLTVKWTGNMA